MGEVAIVDLAAPSQYIRLMFAMSSEKFCFLFACAGLQSHTWKTLPRPSLLRPQEPLYWTGPF
jgi:hypothetical protein